MSGRVLAKLRDGRELTMVLDFEAIDSAESMLGMGLPAILSAMQSAPQMRIARAMVYGALRAKHPEVTAAQVGALMLTADSEALTSALTEAVIAAFPAAGGEDQDEPADPPAPPTRNGTRSKASGRSKA